MSLGIWQIALILIVVLILFGAGKLPRVMGDIGKGVRSLKDGLKDDDSDAQSRQISKDDNRSSTHKKDS